MRCQVSLINRPTGALFYICLEVIPLRIYIFDTYDLMDPFKFALSLSMMDNESAFNSGLTIPFIPDNSVSAKSDSSRRPSRRIACLKRRSSQSCLISSQSLSEPVANNPNKLVEHPDHNASTSTSSRDHLSFDYQTNVDLAQPFDLHPLSPDVESSTIQSLSASSLFRRRLSRRRFQNASSADHEKRPRNNTKDLVCKQSNNQNCRFIGESVSSVRSSTSQTDATGSQLNVDIPSERNVAIHLDSGNSPRAFFNRRQIASNKAISDSSSTLPLPIPSSSISSPGNFKKLLRDRYLSSQGKSDLFASSESLNVALSNVGQPQSSWPKQQLPTASETSSSYKNFSRTDFNQSSTALAMSTFTGISSHFVPQTVPYRREHSVPWNAELLQSLPKYQALNQSQLPDLERSPFLRSPSSCPVIAQISDGQPDAALEKELSFTDILKAGASFSNSSSNVRATDNFSFSLSSLASLSTSFNSDRDGTYSQSAPISPHQFSVKCTHFGNLMRSQLRSALTSKASTPFHYSPFPQESSGKSTAASANRLSRNLTSFYPVPSVDSVSVSSQLTSSPDSAFSRLSSRRHSPSLPSHAETGSSIPIDRMQPIPTSIGAFVFPPPSPIPLLDICTKSKQTDTPLSSLSWISSLSTGSLNTDSVGSPFRSDDPKDQSAALVELMANLTRVPSLRSPMCFAKNYSPNLSAIISQRRTDKQMEVSSTTALLTSLNTTHPAMSGPYQLGNEKRLKSSTADRAAKASRDEYESSVKPVISSTTDAAHTNPSAPSTRGHSNSLRSRGSGNASSHVCPICSRQFNRSDMLVRHLHVHTGSRPFECRECGQAFSRSDHLSTHQRTHTGHRPYRCSLCSYSACRRDMITRHLRVHQRKNQRDRVGSVFHSFGITDSSVASSPDAVLFVPSAIRSSANPPRARQSTDIIVSSLRMSPRESVPPATDVHSLTFGPQRSKRTQS